MVWTDLTGLRLNILPVYPVKRLCLRKLIYGVWKTCDGSKYRRGKTSLTDRAGQEDQYENYFYLFYIRNVLK